MATLVLGHGAGAPQTHPFMVRMALGLARRGVHAVTFNFAYAEKGRGRPDRNDALEECFARVIDAVRARGTTRARTPLFIGGKSMGGRIASQVAASGHGDARGLVFLGYPLHPPGKPEKLRSKHLPSIAAPMLFVHGTRDPFGTVDELSPIMSKLTIGTKLYVVEGGDHSFGVLKRPLVGKRVPQEQVYESILDEIARWIGGMLGTRTPSPARSDDARAPQLGRDPRVL